MTIEIPHPDEQTQELFRLLFSLQAEFPGQWCLIGGYMVYLLALEAGLRFRQTTDADVMADPSQRLLARISAHLIEQHGMEAEETPDGKRYRFRSRGDAADAPIVDLLAIDHAGPRVDLTTDPPGRTLEVPGGRQAFKTSRTVEVRVGNLVGKLLVPSLSGALRLKLEALNLSGGTGDPERHLQDLALLLTLIEDPLEFSRELKPEYRRRLAETKLAARSADCWSYLDGELADKGHMALTLLRPDKDG
jgi:hypothetical protein